MAGNTWTEQLIGEFFATRKSPTRTQCDQLALSVSNRSAVHPVDVPGSLSYTVICSHPPNPDVEHGGALVVSFRQLESEIKEEIVDLAQEIHGNLVPETHCYGVVSASDPPLAVYTMALLPGVACLEALSCVTDLGLEEEAKHVCFMRHLARYFARSWSMPQRTESLARAEQLKRISQKLESLLASPLNVVSTSVLSNLISILPSFYSIEHPQVLTHGDLTKTNILVDPSTLEITGIVDWSLAAVQPFGFDLDCIFLMTGHMDLKGWHDFSCRPRLLVEFWEEFWRASAIPIDGGVSREGFRSTAEAAAKISAILRYAFDRNSDGSSSEALSTASSMNTLLKAWFEVPLNSDSFQRTFPVDKQRE